MDEDPILLAISVILTQVRSARRAIEEVERNTSRYLGFEFAQALSEGARFGAPPMFHGALRVHVININDLAPGNSFGDFLMGLLGGVGNFIGGLVGGMVGGTVAGLALPEMIGRIERITQNIRDIMNRLGVQQAPPPPPPPPAGTPPPTTPPAATGETLLTTLRGIGTMVTELTALFRVASSGGSTSDANAAGRAAPEVLSASGERWLTILGGVNHLLDRVANVVNGLIILIPMVIGSIALLISNLGGIRRAILETFQFVLRNLLVLRGVLLTTIFETVASAARLVAAIVGLLSTAIQSAIGSIFTMVAGIIGAAFDAITTLAQTLQSVIGTLLTWLVTGVFTVLRAIGDLPVFRTIDHVVRILPAVLEPIYNIVVAFKTGAAGTGFSADIRTALAAATAAGNATTATPPTAGTTPADPAAAFATPPDFTADFAAASTTLRDLIGTARTEMNTAVVESFDAAGGALTGIAGTFNGAIRREADFSRGLLNTNLQPLTDRADALARAISAPIAATSAPTGFEDISAAYERWLTGDGLARTLNLATAQFASTATATDGSAVTDRLGLARGQADTPRANIEIDRVEIVIGDPVAANDAAPGPVGVIMPGEELPLTDEAIWRAWHRHNLDLEDRAVRVTDVRELIA